MVMVVMVGWCGGKNRQVQFSVKFCTWTGYDDHLEHFFWRNLCNLRFHPNYILYTPQSPP